MPKEKLVIFRHYCDIHPITTNHGVGEKYILATGHDVGIPITQIAQTTLHRGEHVDSHVHPTMEEHFIFLDGQCNVIIEGNCYYCNKGDYLFVPANHFHEIIVEEETILITIGIETCSKNTSE